MRAFVLVMLGLVLLSGPLHTGFAHAGSAGVHNGGIQGVVYDDRGAPLEGVNVVAVRQIAPQVILSATTDVMGNYFIGNVYLGEYVLGFAKFGFKTIDTATGASDTGGFVTGPTVKAFIDSGQSFVVPRVTMRSEPDQTVGNINITVQDLTDTQPIKDANVTLGAFGAMPGATPGTYRLQVQPVYANGIPAPQTVQIIAEGFATFTAPVTVFPNQTQNLTFRLTPGSVDIQGRLVLSPPGPTVDLTKVNVRVLNLTPTFTSGSVDSMGNFALKLPASTTTIHRTYTLQFNLGGFASASVPNVASPMTGALTLPQDVVLKSEQVNVVGQVFLSTGQAASGGTDSVLVEELGQQFPVNAGQFSIPVPVGRELTLKVTAMNGGRLENIEQKVTASGTDGGTFNVGPIFTKPF